jgi:excinuclease ABC subunit C
MSRLFASRNAIAFSPTRLLPPPARPLHTIQALVPKALRSLVRRECPRLPGVYGMFDANGELIYVGKAKRLRTRLLSYFLSRKWHDKAKRILSCTRTIAWEILPSEFAALLRELELIHDCQPRFNLRNNPGRRRYVYLCLGRRPAPYVFLTRSPASTALDWYGPIPNQPQLREAMRRINDGFRLRDCPQAQQMIFADQQELFPEPLAAACLRFEIGTCLGPCAALCSRSTYRRQVQSARAFLDGKDAALIDRLRQEMAASSTARDYERAATLRDQVSAVQALWDYLAYLREIRAKYTFAYPVDGHSGRRLWYFIRQAKVVTVVANPKNLRLRPVGPSVNGDGSATNPTALSPIELDALLLLTSWFRKHPKEQAKWLPLD